MSLRKFFHLKFMTTSYCGFPFLVGENFEIYLHIQCATHTLPDGSTATLMFLHVLFKTNWKTFL